MSPKPTVDVYDFAQKVDLDALAESLKRAGGIILRNIATPEEVAQMDQDIRPFIEQDSISEESTLFPPTTR